MIAGDNPGNLEGCPVAPTSTINESHGAVASPDKDVAGCNLIIALNLGSRACRTKFSRPANAFPDGLQLRERPTDVQRSRYRVSLQTGRLSALHRELPHRI